jgi:hypothetical protein
VVGTVVVTTVPAVTAPVSTVVVARLGMPAVAAAVVAPLGVPAVAGVVVARLHVRAVPDVSHRVVGSVPGRRGAGSERDQEHCCTGGCHQLVPHDWTSLSVGLSAPTQER